MNLVHGDNPVEPQRDAKLVRQGPPQIDLEPGRISRLAGEWKRVGVSAQPKRSDRKDRVERPRLRRPHQANDDPDHKLENCVHAVFSVRMDRISSVLSLAGLKWPDVLDDLVDLRVAE